MTPIPDLRASETIVDFGQARAQRMARQRNARPFSEKVAEAQRIILQNAGLLFVLDPKPLDASGPETRTNT